MSTNPPKAPYGHYPASLGGSGMGERQSSDLFWNNEDGWENIPELNTFVSSNYYTRKIDPGPEHELVGEDEVVPEYCERTDDGINWIPVRVTQRYSVKTWIQNGSKVLALRRRKVVKEQWPKYWQLGERNVVSRQVSKDSLAEVWCVDGQWKYCPIVENDTPITPQRAFDLTGDKSILGKEDGTQVNFPPAKSPVLDPEPSSPAWIPVGERLPDKGRPFWILTSTAEMECVSAKYILAQNMQHWFGSRTHITSWMYAEGIYQVPPPPTPKTQQEKDEEWIESILNKAKTECKEHEKWVTVFLPLMRSCMQSALAYARGEKVKE